MLCHVVYATLGYIKEGGVLIKPVLDPIGDPVRLSWLISRQVNNFLIILAADIKAQLTCPLIVCFGLVHVAFTLKGQSSVIIGQRIIVFYVEGFVAILDSSVV